MPDAASGSQRSNQTRRDASTTSKGAFWKPIASEYGSRVSRSGALRQGAADDPVAFECRLSGRGETQGGEELAVVLTEQRCMAVVDPLGTPGEAHRQRAVAR